ncbi:MAG: hypothetical protein P1V20_27810 [Verrucomicrobiales bacterium]|nr:hypothetical protein [Verrucomicrobiales bacterium]
MCAAEIDFLNRSAQEKPSNNGTITLSWNNPDSIPVILEQAADMAFSNPVKRYEGTDTGSVISGLPEGTHYFRIYKAGDTTSPGRSANPIKVSVEFFPRDQLFLLLTIGGLVVGGTIGTIIFGYFRTRDSVEGKEEVGA